MKSAHLSWVGIVRVGLVQCALGSIVVLATSTLNRVMVVELALPATLPGILLGLHYAVQLSRPRWGHGSDVGGSRTRWIVGGMAVLAASIVAAAFGVVLMETNPALGIAVAAVAYFMIGVGIGAAGTSALALLATLTAPRRRAAAATIVWLMMIFGIAVTAGVAGSFLDPWSPARLLTVVATVAAGAFALATLAVWGVERSVAAPQAPDDAAAPFGQVLREVWAEPEARRFTVFVFLSMFAYNTQELILEPYAGHVFAYTLGESTMLSSTQHQGVFLGMVAVGIGASGLKLGSLRFWTVAGCLASAAALAVVAALGQVGPGAPLRAAVFALGVANGAFATAAIASMMGLAGAGKGRREGVRVGFWGAAQAIGFGLGAFGGAAAVDLARIALDEPRAYGVVFLAEGALFLVSALLAVRIAQLRPAPSPALVPGE